MDIIDNKFGSGLSQTQSDKPGMKCGYSLTGTIENINGYDYAKLKLRKSEFKILPFNDALVSKHHLKILIEQMKSLHDQMK